MVIWMQCLGWDDYVIIGLHIGSQSDGMIASTVAHWVQEARAAEVPDFNKTVSEYTSQSTTPTSESSDSSLTKELRILPSVPKPAAGGGKQSRGPVMQIKEAVEKHLNQGGAGVV
jgi:hypothetical protein